MLRKSPRLTPASLAARRANALKSTGPRTDRGKAWSSLNALRHGRRAWDLRAKIARTGDRQALLLFRLDPRQPGELLWPVPKGRRLVHDAPGRARLVLFDRARAARRMDSSGERLTPQGLARTYRYGGGLVCPAELQITCRHGRGIRFRNPTLSRRKHVKDSWVPEVEFFEVPPRLPRAKRVGGAGAALVAAQPCDDVAHYPGSHKGRPYVVPNGETGSPAKLECALESATCLEESRRGVAGPLEAPAGAAPSSLSASDFEALELLEELEEGIPANLGSLLDSLTCSELSAASGMAGLADALATWQVPLLVASPSSERTGRCFAPGTYGLRK